MPYAELGSTAAEWQVVWADSRWYGPARMSNGRDGNFKACRGLCRKLAWILRIGECECGCNGTQPQYSQNFGN